MSPTSYQLKENIGERGSRGTYVNQKKIMGKECHEIVEGYFATSK